MIVIQNESESGQYFKSQNLYRRRYLFENLFSGGDVWEVYKRTKKKKCPFYFTRNCAIKLWLYRLLATSSEAQMWSVFFLALAHSAAFDFEP